MFRPLLLALGMWIAPNLAHPLAASTIEECMAACNLYLYSPSTFEVSVTVLKEPWAGEYEGIQGTFHLEQWDLELSPYVWIPVFESAVPPYGPLLYTGWGEYKSSVRLPNILLFEYFDIPVPQTIVVSADPPQSIGAFYHTLYMWVCTEGITPPVPYSRDGDVEPAPEPMSALLAVAGLAAIAFRTRCAGRKTFR